MYVLVALPQLLKPLFLFCLEQLLQLFTLLCVALLPALIPRAHTSRQRTLCVAKLLNAVIIFLAKKLVLQLELSELIGLLLKLPLKPVAVIL